MQTSHRPLLLITSCIFPLYSDYHHINNDNNDHHSNIQHKTSISTTIPIIAGPSTITVIMAPTLPSQAEFFVSGITPAPTQPTVDVLCGICHEELDGNTVQLTGACNHLYHGICIVTWLQGSTLGRSNNTCPYCRTELYNAHANRAAVQPTFDYDFDFEDDRLFELMNPFPSVGHINSAIVIFMRTQSAEFRRNFLMQHARGMFRFFRQIHAEVEPMDLVTQLLPEIMRMDEGRELAIRLERILAREDDDMNGIVVAPMLAVGDDEQPTGEEDAEYEEEEEEDWMADLWEVDDDPTSDYDPDA